MNEHAGPACALSGLIVAIFAILLYDPNLPTPTPKSLASQAGPAPPLVERSSANAIAPQATQPVAVAPQPAPVPEPKPVPAEIRKSPEPEPQAAPAVVVSPAKVPPKRRTPPTGPRPSFAVVEPGERLADVAARIYGSEDAAEALWKANRDQVARIDSPLDRGTLLRTP